MHFADFLVNFFVAAHKKPLESMPSLLRTDRLEQAKSPGNEQRLDEMTGMRHTWR